MYCKKFKRGLVSAIINFRFFEIILKFVFVIKYGLSIRFDGGKAVFVYFFPGKQIFCICEMECLAKIKLLVRPSFSTRYFPDKVGMSTVYSERK